jgi:protocatechuate 3,4-dioxygenase beta subunit
MSFQKKLVIACCLAALALGGAAFVLLTVGTRSARERTALGPAPARSASPAETGAPAATAAEAPPASAGALEAEATAVEPATVAAEGGWTLTGRILRAPRTGDGVAGAEVAAAEPAPGVRITLKAHPRKTRPEDAPTPRELATDASGRFEFTGVPGKPNLRLEIDEPDSSFRALSFRLGDPGPDPRKDLGDIALEPAASLVVELVGPGEKPAAGAQVLVGRRSNEGDEALQGLGFNDSRREALEKPGGRYLLERARPGSQRVEVVAPGCAPARAEVDLPTAEPLVIRLGAGKLITGRVSSLDGKAIAGARIEVKGPGMLEPDPAVSSDRAGTFRIDFLGTGDYALAASAEGFADARTSVASETEGVEIQLAREAVLAGKVVSGDGEEPVARARVSVAGNQGVRRDAVTGDGGLFETRRIGPGTWTVRIEHDEHAPLEETIEFAEGEKALDRVFRLGSGAIVRGKVLDAATRAPIAGARVNFREGGNQGARKDVTAGEDGSFEARGLGESAYLVTASAKRYLPGRSVPVTATAGGNEDLTLVLEEGASIAGRVSDPDGKPIRGATLHVNLAMLPGVNWNDGLNNIYNLSADTDAEGKYVLAGLGAHPSYTVTASHRDYAPASARAVKVERRAAVEGVDLTLFRGGTVKGRVLDEQGEPVAGASVVADLERRGEELPEQSMFGQRDQRSATSAADGTYALPRLEAATYAVRARLKDKQPGVQSGVEVAEGGSVEGIDITLGRGETISGRIVDADGNPIDNVNLNVWDESQAQARSDAEGRFELKGLKAGMVQVHLEKQGFGRKDVDIQSPKANAEFVLDRMGRILGRVRAKDVQAFPEFNVMAIEQAPKGPIRYGPSQSRSSNRDGSFEIEVGAGTFILQASVPGFAVGQSEALTVAAGERREGVTIDLEPGGTIEGVVFLAGSGLPVEGARVQAVEANRKENWWNPGREASALSGQDGSFVLEGVTPGTVEVRAEHPEYAAGSAPGIAVRSRGKTQVRIELRAGGTVRGLVERGGKPMAGTQVYLQYRSGAGPQKSAVTAADGTFEIKGLLPGEYTATASAMGRRGAGWQMTEGVSVVEGQTVELRFSETGAAIRLSGRVLSGDVPVSGGSLFFAQLERGWGGMQVEIDAGGNYSVELPRTGTYMIMASIGDRRQGGLKLRVDIPEGSASFRYDILVPSGSITGTVVDAETGRGVGGIEIATFAAGAAATSFLALFNELQAMGRTDDSGNFHIPGIPAGNYDLQAMLDGYAQVPQPPVEVVEGRATEGVRIVIERGVSFRARVLDPAGKPLARAMGLLREAGGALVLMRGEPPASDGEGVLELRGLRPGTYRLSVSHPAFATARQTVNVAAGGAPEPVFRLQQGGKVQVVVAGRNGTSIEGARVHVVNDRGEDVTDDGFPFKGGAASVATGPQGFVVVGPVAAGTYRVSAEKGEVRSRDEKVAVGEGETVEVRVALE